MKKLTLSTLLILCNFSFSQDLGETVMSFTGFLGKPSLNSISEISDDGTEVKVGLNWIKCERAYRVLDAYHGIQIGDNIIHRGFIFTSEMQVEKITDGYFQLSDQEWHEAENVFRIYDEGDFSEYIGKKVGYKRELNKVFTVTNVAENSLGEYLLQLNNSHNWTTVEKLSFAVESIGDLQLGDLVARHDVFGRQHIGRIELIIGSKLLLTTGELVSQALVKKI